MGAKSVDEFIFLVARTVAIRYISFTTWAKVSPHPGAQKLVRIQTLQ